jgi:glycopeptide antibiotics resistance protein
MHVFLATIADLLVNLSAGWLGVVFIVPNFSKKKGLRKVIILTLDICAAIVCLVAAFMLRTI